MEPSSFFFFFFLRHLKCPQRPSILSGYLHSQSFIRLLFSSASVRKMVLLFDHFDFLTLCTVRMVLNLLLFRFFAWLTFWGILTFNWQILIDWHFDRVALLILTFSLFKRLAFWLKWLFNRYFRLEWLFSRFFLRYQLWSYLTVGVFFRLLQVSVASAQ